MMSTPSSDPSTKADRFEVLITADQAWPEFERAILEARTEISAAFRLFDFTTRLRSPEAREVGETWFDLVAHVVRRGVRFRLVVSDFDPVMATELHELCWRCKRQAAALAEMVGQEHADQIEVIASLHPARAGLLPRLALMPFVLKKLRDRLRSLNTVRQTRQAIGLRSDEMPELRTVSHHQKVAVIDRTTLYIGGLDLNERRYDTTDHDQPAHATWSDVQVLTTGPEAQEAAIHLDGFLDQIARQTVPRKGTHLRRTLSAPRRFGLWALSPDTLLNEIEAEHIAAFRSAKNLIHIETQFLRSTKLAKALAQAAQDMPDISLILILPALPEDVAFEGNRGLDARYGMALQAKCLDMVQTAFGDRACIASPVQPRLAAREGPGVLAGSPVIHVHNKVLMVDDSMALVGSANMNGRSMMWDTEVALHITDPHRLATLRRALVGHWWHGDVLDEALEIRTAAAWWRREVARNGVKRPEARHGFLVPHDPDKLKDYRQPLPGVTEDIV
ncbi:phospholipase D family protein [Actibacterium sp. 188UL27-1]|uniref:phospholipase D family protein n=1 Tax=Actibacterium sp. 188UL27-1 TaxID=2786961 RepID=UPI001959358D|nr:phospholipase D-like domain-containing protein [Actibacterium sp. 188UL27-1]MBM7069923.1 phosphatidylserine synthase [Actibacterium sp. 188UL27-1]